MGKIDVSWESMTQKIEIDFKGMAGKKLPKDLEKKYKETTKDLTERK